MTLEFRAAIQVGAFRYEAAFEAADEIVVLFGHSGAGKSLTLQMVAGLLRPDAGRIVIDGEVVFDSEAAVRLPAQQRRVGYVVQDLALFPHMTVAENVLFGMPAGIDRRARIRELLGLLGLTGFDERLPRTLSGGQQQRVALARALAREARLLLLDEPFSALDESLRTALRRELVRLRRELGLSIVFVTHDLREAHLLADRLAVFDGGRMLQFGPREEVFRRPVSRRVAELTGVANIWRGRVEGVDGDYVVVDVSGLQLRSVGPGPFTVGQSVDVAIRAERVNLRRVSPEQSGQNMLAAAITEEFAYGSVHSLHLQPVGQGPHLEAELAARPYEVLGIASQRTWTLELPAADLHIMAVEEEAG